MNLLLFECVILSSVLILVGTHTMVSSDMADLTGIQKAEVVTVGEIPVLVADIG